MKSRPKLSGAPLAYTLAMVEGTEIYTEFGAALWDDGLVVPGPLKEFLFIRTSIVNQCPT